MCPSVWHLLAPTKPANLGYLACNRSSALSRSSESADALQLYCELSDFCVALRIAWISTNTTVYVLRCFSQAQKVRFECQHLVAGNILAAPSWLSAWPSPSPWPLAANALVLRFQPSKPGQPTSQTPMLVDDKKSLDSIQMQFWL